MSEGLQLILNDDGVFEEYDDTYDLTIHCESKEDQEDVLNKLNLQWIPVERELPELNRPLLVTAYHRVCYAHMISKNGNYGYPVFRLHELKDSDRGWVQETISHEPYSKGRIDAWMYINIPQPYKAESEE